MATELQKNLAQEIIKNTKRKKPLNKGQMLEKVGYSKNVAEAKPTEILERKGVKEALEDYGFNEDNAKRVVAEILLNERVKPETRIRASEQVFKVHGTYKDNEGGSKTLILVVSGESAQRYNVKPNTITEDSST